jgi:HD-GYP domain-containing protein (c-di-GMP phosphodiesterase class II)
MMNISSQTNANEVLCDLPLFDWVLCLSDAIGLFNPTLVSHNERVAYISYEIAAAQGLPEFDRKKVMVAGALHDIGGIALTDTDRNMLLEYDAIHTYKHCSLGYFLLLNYGPFHALADIILYHHTPWSDQINDEVLSKKVPYLSNIIHLADRVDVLLQKDGDIFNNIDTIRETINESSGTLFAPDLVEGFIKCSQKESFWLDIVSPKLSEDLRDRMGGSERELELDNIEQIAILFSKVIDFRSQYTLTHSIGVASCAEMLGKALDMTDEQCQGLRIAGLLHDTGKLYIPKSILEKPAALVQDEINIIRKHSYYTYSILKRIPYISTINKWASYHHERLDGTGYPFHYTQDEIPEGSRILAISDIFTALMEDRPYRAGMSIDETFENINSMADNNYLDKNIVKILFQNKDAINAARIVSQGNSLSSYNSFKPALL